MIDKFNGVIYLIIFIIHFLGFGVYAYQMIINNKILELNLKWTKQQHL